MTATLDRPVDEAALQAQFDATVAKAYGIYLADRKLAARNTFYIGENGKILAIDTKVATETHGSDVAKKLGELGVAKKK